VSLTAALALVLQWHLQWCEAGGGVRAGCTAKIACSGGVSCRLRALLDFLFLFLFSFLSLVIYLVCSAAMGWICWSHLSSVYWFVEASVIADLCCMPEQNPIPSLTLPNPSNS
jgi:hypothetical protein